jgi:hypothetical protein
LEIFFQKRSISFAFKQPGCFGLAKTNYNGLEIPDKPVFHLAKGGFHRPIFLRHFEPTQSRHARLFQETHDRGRS